MSTATPEPPEQDPHALDPEELPEPSEESLPPKPEPEEDLPEEGEDPPTDEEEGEDEEPRWLDATAAAEDGTVDDAEADDPGPDREPEPD